MRRLGLCILVSLLWACDGSDSSGGDAAASSDTSTMEASVDQGAADGGGLDGQTTTDAAPELDAQAMDMSVPEPDASLLELCTPLGRCNERGGWCEAADHPECWRGEAPACFDALHPLSRANCPEVPGGSTEPLCDCPDGYEAAPGEDICTRATSRRAPRSATVHTVCRGPRAATYGRSGARFQNTDGDESNDVVLDAYWGPIDETDRNSGRLNAVGVWACDWQVRDQSGFDPINEWIGVSHCLSVEAPADYLIGMAADDQVRVKINGTLVFESPADADGTAHWFIHRVALNSGINIVEILGRNQGNVGSLGAEISGPFTSGSLVDEAAQKAADYAGNIVFSTDRLVGGEFHIGDESGHRCAEDGQVVNACRAPLRCTTIEHTPCAAPPIECPAGQHAEDEVCVPNACTCVFGAPAVGEECPNHGDALCIGCVQGYYLSEGACLENECGCENGFAAHSAACEENGAQACLFCDDGYHLEGTSCVANECTCEQGTGASGPLCLVDGDAFCVECNAGLHVEDGVCVPNECVCRNGVFNADLACPDHRGDACSSCDDGYNLVDNQCRSNICVCEHGNRAFGPECPVDGAVGCSSCLDGYRLEGNECLPLQCTCINGTGVHGQGCPRDGALRCAECDEGFRLEGNVCVQAACRCANGQPTVGDACPGVGVQHCASCNDGYYLTDNACAPNVCTCANGFEASGILCPAHEAEYCLNCNPGYRLVDDTCVALNCVCEAGVAAVGPACPAEGAAKCVSCEDGFRLENEACVRLPEPTCEDGLQNADESDVDCGGHCPACGDDRRCQLDAHCQSQVCRDGVCQAPRCGDGVTNGGEACDDGNALEEACPYGERDCQVCGADCAFVAGRTSFCGDGVTDGANGEACDDGNADDSDGCRNTCVVARCDDGVRNGGESDIDCGGPCGACADDRACSGAADCVSQVCAGGLCQAPRCGDGVTNGQEGCDDGNALTEECAYGVEACEVCNDGCVLAAGQTSFCGDGSTDARNGESCDDGNDIDDDACRNNCTSAGCADGLRNGDETDVDCGGSCDPCADDLRCVIAADCVSRVCADGVCRAPRCGDGVINGDENCDDSNDVTEDCDYGERNCQVCDAACRQVDGRVSFCGDGITDGGNGEACDDGNEIDDDACRNTCVRPACDDALQNGDETDVDCGGSCAGCDEDERCRGGRDCVSGRCLGEPVGVDPNQCPDPIVLGGLNEDSDNFPEGSFGNDGRTLVFRYQVPDGPNLTMDRVEFYTGGVNADSVVSVWDHDAAGNQPARRLAETEFSMSRQFTGWDGGRFAEPVTLEAGRTYWVGILLAGGQSSFVANGDSTAYRAGPGDGSAWGQSFNGSAAFRIVRCGGPAAGDRPIVECKPDDPNCGGRCGPPAVCGNGVREGDEACDDGNNVTEACGYGEEACEVCADDCTVRAGATSLCGDGDVDIANGEECDDGNNDAGDGCDAACRTEAPCQGCGCGEDACQIGDRPAVIDTLNFQGMSFRPVHLDDCFPDRGIQTCCPGSTTQEQMNALCRRAGLCRATDWVVESIVADECYMYGTCTNCFWFEQNGCDGSTARNYITRVTCQ